MTIIVYRDGVMAADRAVWIGEGRIVSGHRDKIARLYDGSLYAACGNSSVIRRVQHYVEDWLEDNSRRPDFTIEEPFGLILVRPDGRVFRGFKDLYLYEQEAPFHVDGSSSEFLMGALAAGANAAEAVSLALKYCDLGGDANEIQVVRLK